MSLPVAKSDLLDSDIARLFEKQQPHTSPQDLDIRIIEAAKLAVKSVSNDSFQTPQLVKPRRPWLFISCVLLLSLALLYPVVKSFLDLPTVVQDSSRIIRDQSTVPRLETLNPSQ